MRRNKDSEFSQDEAAERFTAILRGAMHKPTPLKNIPKKRKERPAKSRSATKKEVS
jgi:hypothetical protein